MLKTNVYMLYSVFVYSCFIFIYVFRWHCTTGFLSTLFILHYKIYSVILNSKYSTFNCNYCVHHNMYIVIINDSKSVLHYIYFKQIFEC